MSDPLLMKAISDSSDIVLELAKILSGRTILSGYVALLRLAMTMEVLHPELRPVREPVLGIDHRGVN